MEQFTVREYIVREMGFPGVLKQEIVGEIVRCEDCEHRDGDYCHRFTDGYSAFILRDDFCKYGERRDDAEVTKRTD